jgi:phosphatidylglycerol:prolipoprotein diacylglycerol transferase
MLVHPQFDPVALSLGPVQIHWYGLTYLAAFGLFLLLAGRRVALPHYASAGWTRRDVEDMLFYGVLGVIIGGRMGYALFYKPAEYLAHPAGHPDGLEGRHVLSRRAAGRAGGHGLVCPHGKGRPFWQVMDVVAPCVPTGLAAGRIGNFINGELWGRAADPSLPWAMVFPQSGSPWCRATRRRSTSSCWKACCCSCCCGGMRGARGPRARWPRPSRWAMACCALWPSTFASLTPSWAYLALGLSMGQWLCVPMIAFGAGCGGGWAGAPALGAWRP